MAAGKLLVVFTLLIVAAGSLNLSPLSEEELNIVATITLNETIQKTNPLRIGFQLDGQELGTSVASAYYNNATLRHLGDAADFSLVRFFSHRLYASTASDRPCTNWNSATHTGTWNWTIHDSLVDKLIAEGHTPLIVLGFAKFDHTGLSCIPPTMTINGTTHLPDPVDFAHYCADWATHYAGEVVYYEIINEGHWFYGWPPSDTAYPGGADHPKYPNCATNTMALVKAASNAIRDADGAAKVGHDGSLFKNILDVGSYSLCNDADFTLDFLSFHTYGSDNAGDSDAEMLAGHDDYLSDTSNFYSPANARSRYAAVKTAWPDLMMTEGNAFSVHDDRNFKMVCAVFEMMRLKDYVLHSAPISYLLHFTFASDLVSSNAVGMINKSTLDPHYPYYAFQLLNSHLSYADNVTSATSDDANLEVLSWTHSGKRCLMLIRTVNTNVDITVSGSVPFTYEYIDGSYAWDNPHVITGSLAADATLGLQGYAVVFLVEDTPETFDVLVQAGTGGTVIDPYPALWQWDEASNHDLTAQASNGYAFDKWTGLGGDSTDNPFTLTVTESGTITATFTNIGARIFLVTRPI